jgi:RimJ/RimL family protein N-acetyltransferase
MITELDFVDFNCPYCNELVSFPQQDAGFARACPNCMEATIVPTDGSQAGRKLPIPVETPNLILRRLVPGDWKDLMDCFSGWEEENILRWLEADSQVKLTTPEQMFHLGIVTRNGGKLIGFLGLRFTDAERLQVALNVTLPEPQQESELAVEAVDALLGFCFEGIKLHRVAATAVATGAPSLFDKAGMRREGEFLKDQHVDGKWLNTVCYAALAEEYLGATENPPA